MSLKFKGSKVVTSDLRFKPDEKIGNLCIGHLVKVEVLETKVEKIKEDGSEMLWEYAGFTVPYLQFTFIQAKKDKSERDRVLNHIERVITFTDSEGNAVDKDIINSLFEEMGDRLIHLHDSYKKDVNYKALPDIDFDEKGDVKARLESFKAFFTAIADAFNKGANDKPVYTGSKGEFLPLYIKVIPEYKRRRFYTLPRFVGKGFVERFLNQPPSIELSPKERRDFELLADGEKAPANASKSEVIHEDVDDTIKDLIKD